MKSGTVNHAPFRKGVAIGGIRGGSGKTVFSVGLIEALKRRGFSIAPFKKGPDYIDPSWLSRASGAPCYNLDMYLMDPQKNISAYRDGNGAAGFAVVEGNRGLFDGLDVEGTYSFSELVKLLRVPLLLVLDCSKASRTIAALVHGCETFDRDLPLKGIILNQIAGERHRKTITEAVEKYCRTPVLGAIPRLSDLSLEERSLGLVPAGEHNRPDEIIETLGDIVAANTDIEAILRLTGADGANDATRGHPFSAGEEVVHATDGVGRRVRKKRRVGIIRDAAFSFYYTENLEALKGSGAEIVEINSLVDRTLPPVDALYIGGGFPEAHAAALGRNRYLRGSLKGAVERGLPVYAECGGLIYLSRSIIIGETSHPMTGIFPFVFELSKKPVGHGYTLFEVDGPNPFYKNGAVVRGHEFRYARITNTEEIERVRTVFRMERGMGIGNGRDGVLRNNCLAAFTHTHAGSDNVQWINALAAGGDAE